MIEQLIKHTKKIATGEHEQVKPGMEFYLTNAAVNGDGVWQGDLGLEVVTDIPQGYTKAKKPTTQLVIGNTQGSKHCLDSLEGVTLYHPKHWNEESLIGPCFSVTKERRILHPTHGAIIIAAGLTILCRYQREWDIEQRKERRALD